MSSVLFAMKLEVRATFFHLSSVSATRRRSASDSHMNVAAWPEYEFLNDEPVVAQSKETAADISDVESCGSVSVCRMKAGPPGVFSQTNVAFVPVMCVPVLQVQQSTCASNISTCESTSCGTQSDTWSEQSDEELETRTTLIFKNLPSGCNRTELLRVLDSEGFKAQYDFLYLPSNMTTGGSYCYAFVNMVSNEAAAAVVSRLAGFNSWSQGLGQPAMQVFWSDIQGQDTYVDKYRNSPVMHPSVPEECKPAVFACGERVPFAPPTKQIKAPRLRDRSMIMSKK